MDSDDDFYFDSPNINSSSSARKNQNKHTTSSSHKTTRELKKPINIPEKITGGEHIVQNLLSNLASYLFSQYKQKNSTENEIVFIKGQPTQRAEKDSYKLVNPDFEGKVMYIKLIPMVVIFIVFMVVNAEMNRMVLLKQFLIQMVPIFKNIMNMMFFVAGQVLLLFILMARINITKMENYTMKMDHLHIC